MIVAAAAKEMLAAVAVAVEKKNIQEPSEFNTFLLNKIET